MSEEKSRSIISNSPIGISVTNAEGQCVSTNKAMADIIGATKEQILGQNFNELESWKPSGLYEATINAINNNKTEHINAEITTSFGKNLHLSCYFTPISNGELLIIMQDISKLMMTQNKLGNALKDKDMLLKEVHHRVKNHFGFNAIRAPWRLTPIVSGQHLISF